MLYAMVFKLVAQSNGNLPPDTGHLTHAAFLDLVRQVDPDLSGHFHDANERKPYTVSPLLGHGNPPDTPIRLGAGQEVWIRISLLDSRLFQVVAAHLLNHHPLPELRLQNVPFSIVQALTAPDSHPRAGYAALDELYQRWLNAPVIPDTVTLRFLTPTAIRSGTWPDGRKRYTLIPEPELLWHGLRRQWGGAGGPDPGKSYDAWVQEFVGLIAYDLHTHLVHFPGYDQVGFEGWATFRAVSQDQDKLALWRALADFAFFSGAGYKTSMGLGQVAVSEGDGRDA